MVNITVQGYNIRPIEQSEAELARVLAVYRQCEDFLALGPVATASAEMVAADLALSRQEGGTFCAIEAMESGEMVGVVDFVCAGFESDPELAFLSLLIIAAPHRNRGLGAAVVRGVEDAIRRDGRVRAIRSGVQVNNPDGIRFWQRMGYKIISGAEPQVDGTVAFRLWKKIG
jgi:ribosomal protein S18 acetylase RimI-like enzyme